MLTSVITPTHRPEHLEAAYRSLRAQTDENFEWVILPSNIEARDIPAGIRRDSRIRILKPTDETRVGALKRAAFLAGRGDILVELDHDDMLTPDCLARVRHLANHGAGFIYSDDAVFQDNGVSWGYSKTFRWQHYVVRVYGRPLIATRCFPISPRSLCEVYFAPDHVRAWTRATYTRVGGHDATMSVADDHDLVCRTYLAGAPFGYTNSCGYLYRWHPGNTIKERGALIKKGQTANRFKYLFGLAVEWSRRSGRRVVDLGVSPRPDGNVGVCVTKEPATADSHWDVMAPGGLLRCIWFDGDKPEFPAARWDVVHAFKIDTTFGPAYVSDAIALKGQLSPKPLARSAGSM